MISASKEFKEKLKRNRVPLANFADITLSNGIVKNLEPEDFRLDGGCSIEDKTTDGKFGVGFCIGKNMSIRIDNKDERFSSYDFYMSTIRLYVAMRMDNGTIEKIRKGVFYATIPETGGDVIEISAVDGMYRLDRDYSESSTPYPATIQRIISDACLDCGIPIGFTQFDNMSYVVQKKPENCTYRQVVSWACQIAGYNAHIDSDGYMQLIWYNTSLIEGYNHYDGGNFITYPHDTVIDGGDFTNYGKGIRIDGGNFTDPRPEHIYQINNLNVHTDDVVITGVRVIGEYKAVALSGEVGYVIEISGNPFAYGHEQAVADYLGQRMVGVAFRPFSAEVFQNPLYEPFDVVMVSDRKGNVYNSFLNYVSYKIGGYTEVACQAEDPVRNGSSYMSPAAAAVVEARRNTDRQISSYDKAVQQLNQIAMNSMGFHTTYEEQQDGSRIVYLHDKPTLEESTTIYKQTIDGFFISTDGGKSYTAGFDSQGNTVVNVLSAIGIQADWINVTDLVAFNATIAGWTIETGQIIGHIDLYSDMSASGLSGVGGDSPVQYFVWMRKPVNSDTTVFAVCYRNKNDYLSNSSQVYSYFHVKADGRIYATKANVTGAIYAESGTFAGELKAATGTFKGSLSAATGTFKGELNAATGTFSGGITSSSATITGGSFKVNTSSSEASSIEIKYGNDVSYLSPNFLRLSKSNYNSYYRANKIAMSYDSGSSEIMFFEATKDNLYTSGGFVSGGQKNRVVRTKSYSDRLLYCYETPKPYFGDIGEAKLDETGTCYIFLDDIFRETVNTECQYQVFLQKYGEGDLWVSERTTDYFIVKGAPNLSFGWEIKARQLGYESERLEKFVHEEEDTHIDYVSEAQSYIDDLYKEVFNYEESDERYGFNDGRGEESQRDIL